MSEKSFEELPVWQSSVELARRVFKLAMQLKHPPLAMELEKTCLAISNYIVAGVVSGRKEMLTNALIQARIRVAQVHSMLWTIGGADDQKEVRSEVEHLKLLSGRLERYVRGWIASLETDSMRMAGSQSQAEEEAAAMAQQAASDPFAAAQGEPRDFAAAAEQSAEPMPALDPSDALANLASQKLDNPYPPPPGN